MNKFAYQVFYEYSGPTSNHPLRTPKSAVEIDGVLSTFPNDLSNFFAAGTDVRVSQDKKKRTANSIVVVIETTAAEQQVVDAVERCLHAFDLFGKILK